MSDEKTKRAVSIQEDKLVIDEEAANRNFGSTDIDFITGIATQLINVASKGAKPDDDGIAFMSAVLKAAKPRDELESMLALQMAAIHNATMTFARRLAHVENLPQQDSAERALNKLARTYAMQLQALQKYRSGGKQKVVVKHVHVNEGGQAVVGNIETGGRG